jgi:hypothetical protein
MVEISQTTRSVMIMFLVQLKAYNEYKFIKVIL